MEPSVTTAAEQAVAAPASRLITVSQVVCDVRRSVIGHEVASYDPQAAATPAQSSAQALLDAFTTLGHVAPHRPAYLRIAPDLLRRMDMLPLASDRAVLQLDCSAPLDPVTVSAFRRYAGLGYLLAARDPAPGTIEALGCVRLARVDVRALEPEAAAAVVTGLVERGLTVHALGVATPEAFERCAAAGATGFQGPFRAVPVPEELSSTRATALASVSELAGCGEDFDRLETIIARDLALSYRLLRYVNSAFFSLRREIATVREAMTMLGERMTRRWALVVALAGATSQRTDGLLFDALLRARMLEELAGEIPGLNPDYAFTVGLFSLLDALVGQPLDELVPQLALPHELEAALLGGLPPYGGLLEHTVRFLDADLGPLAGSPGMLARLDVACRAATVWLETLRAELTTIA